MENVREDMEFKEVVKKDDHEEDKGDEVIKWRQICDREEEELFVCGS
jgi:hypothetical protein